MFQIDLNDVYSDQEEKDRENRVVEKIQNFYSVAFRSNDISLKRK